ncbi:MAG TPA: TrkA C-terminal domain-containing protein [Gemmatimonadales bacterium]|nr:TrkA C-terminal domain-containing protein [Gemmatimonadales bacterium]
MIQRLRDRVTFVLERLLVRGAHWRILVIAFAIALISLLGGILVYPDPTPRPDPFDNVGEAIWWAFLRLTDPGYLGDDQGTWRRIVSTALTIIGYVIFLGALIAVMTQWLNALMRNLERGLTPIAENGHILLLGWTDRTPTIVRELLVSEGRVRRFLRRHQAKNLRIVILAEDVGPQYVQELRDALGDLWDGRRIILRSGSPLRVQHLERTDFLHASVIVIPGADFVGGIAIGDASQTADTAAIKILLSIANHAAARRVDELPQVVAEIADARKAAIAQRVYPGSVEVVASDLFISRLITQNVRNRGLSHLTAELFAHGPGNEIYVREHPDLAGTAAAALPSRFRRAIVVGVVRPDGHRYRPILSPPPDLVLEPGDKLVLIARHYEDTDPAPEPETPEMTDAVAPAAVPRMPPRQPAPRRPRRILILGWSHRVPALVSGFGAYERDEFELDIVSTIAPDLRTRELAQYGAGPSGVRVRQIEGDYTVPADLARLDPAAYDHILLLGSSWLPGREESDARTVLGYLLLREQLGNGARSHVLAELMDPGNLTLFREQPAEVFVTPQIVSRILAQVALRPELGPVFDEIFGPSGCAISFTAADALGVGGREVSFDEIQQAAGAHGAVALGIRVARDATHATGGIRLNPAREKRWTLEPGDQVIVLDEVDP